MDLAFPGCNLLQVRPHLAPGLSPRKRDQVTYSEIEKLIEQLSYRDKLRLAQLLIQLARKEEEEQNPEKRELSISTKAPDPELIQYVAERLSKLKPTKKQSLLNSIGAMFQFQGGISDADKETFVTELQRRRYITIDHNDRVTYPEQGQV